jgi:cytochrome c2
MVWCVAVASAQIKILPGSAARGEQLLTDKACVNCHSLNGRGGNRAPDLAGTPPHAQAPELLASAIWNHATEMWVDAASGARWNTQLTSGDAADLFAYLYSVLYFSLPGDTARGKIVFERKSCSDCHKEVQTAGAPGRAISTWAAVNDPIVWAERMWNHSSEMKKATLRKGFQWPTLSSQDVADLMIYLRSLPVLRAKSSSFRMGEPEQGQPVFERNCESCHSFGPAPGKKIDLLGRPVPRTVTGYIAAMWNHAPLMRTTATTSLPALRPGEMPDLIAFLFSKS